LSCSRLATKSARHESSGPAYSPVRTLFAGRYPPRRCSASPRRTRLQPGESRDEKNTVPRSARCPHHPPIGNAEPRVAAALTDSEIRQQIIQQSVAAYFATGHPCACPYNSARNGSSCGGRSAYGRPGGAAPLCLSLGCHRGDGVGLETKTPWSMTSRLPAVTGSLQALPNQPL
jgi:hypothetical protein